MKELSKLISEFEVARKENKDRGMPLQTMIEDLLKAMVQEGKYESLFLFSQEGLAIAQHISSGDLREPGVMEISVMIFEVKKAIHKLSGLSDLHEVVVEGKDKKKVIFRFIPFLGQTAILVIVVPGRQSYRALTNRVQKAISYLGKNDLRN